MTTSHITTLRDLRTGVQMDAQHDTDGAAKVAALDAAIAALELPGAQPVAWVRRHPDGVLTAEILPHAEIEAVRRESGAWVPLCVAPQSAAEALTPDEARQVATQARNLNGPSDTTSPTEYVMAGALAATAKAAQPQPSGNAGELPRAWPRVLGVSRDMHPRCLVLSLAAEPSDDDVRAIHKALTADQRRAQGMTEQDDRDLAVGRLWRENSSLEEWFPLTAEELESHKRMLRSAVSDLAAICAALGLDENYNGPHEALSAIESLKAQQPADAAAFRLLVAAGNRIDAEAEEFEGPDGMAVSIETDYWHEFDAALDRARAALAAQPSEQGPADLPTWEGIDAREFAGQPLTALERFILDHEPDDAEGEQQFRAQLQAVLAEAARRREGDGNADS